MNDGGLSGWIRAWRALACIALAGVICWRGYAYAERAMDPNPASLPLTMCMALAVVLVLLALASLADRGELDAPEQPPTRRDGDGQGKAAYPLVPVPVSTNQPRRRELASSGHLWR